MKRFKFQYIYGLFLLSVVLGPSGWIDRYDHTLSISLLPGSIRAFVIAQDAATATPASNGASAYITQTYSEAINVRTGPSTVDYPTIGQLPVGSTAPALATSPHHEWIEISFPAGPGGVGWIYAANVTLTGTLQVVEPPPTATPLATATIDPTLVAAFQIEPTVTRLPTFTPAPPLVIPTYPDPTVPVTGFPIGGAIFVIAVLAIMVLVVSLFGRR
jgi:uncharacterized protein YraI